MLWTKLVIGPRAVMLVFLSGVLIDEMNGATSASAGVGILETRRQMRRCRKRKQSALLHRHESVDQRAIQNVIQLVRNKEHVLEL
jgi:hypothetical protein